MQYPISNSTQPTGIATLVDSLGLLFGGCSPKVVEGDPEPLVDLGVDGVVLVDDLPRRHPLLQRLRLRLRPVLVRPADVQRVVAPQATEPGKGIQFGDGLIVGYCCHIALEVRSALTGSKFDPSIYLTSIHLQYHDFWSNKRTLLSHSSMGFTTLCL